MKSFKSYLEFVILLPPLHLLLLKQLFQDSTTKRQPVSSFPAMRAHRWWSCKTTNNTLAVRAQHSICSNWHSFKPWNFNTTYILFFFVSSFSVFFIFILPYKLTTSLFFKILCHYPPYSFCNSTCRTCVNNISYSRYPTN